MAFSAILCACDKQKHDHNHKFGEYEITVAAGCEIPGELTRTCSVCGYKETEVISASHAWTAFNVTLEADCDTTGEQTRKCTKCGKEETKPIPTTRHNWSEYKITTKATCKIVGEKTRSCSICGAEETEQIDKIEHDWSGYEITTPAKCLADGERTCTCLGCGEKESMPIFATGHAWSAYETTTQAKCLTSGEKTRTCSKCGDAETEIIPATGHAWSLYETTTPAKCMTAGEKKRTCSRCGNTETETISATGHSWRGVEVIEQATCEQDGYQSAICSVCNETSNREIIPAFGHTAGKVLPVTAPTCESEGINRVTCAVCSKGYNEKVAPTGHNYSPEFTVDRAPTINEEGVRSRHCLNYKCTSKTDIQVIEKLRNEATFRIKIVRGENQTLIPTTYNPMIKIINEKGVAVVTTFVFGNGDKEHIFEKVLPFGTYTVSIVNDLPKGFECDSYTISENDGIYPYDTPDKYPTVTMHLYSHLGTGAMTDGDKKNTVLNDFSVTTIDGKTVWLSELLKEKRLVWLNFYYNDCYNCKIEAPTIVRVAQQYDVAVICFNGRDSVDQIASGAKSIFNFPDSFYIVHDIGNAFGKMFGCFAYPLNVFIDSGGLVFESVTGSNHASQFNEFVKNNLFSTPQTTDTASVQIVQMPAILPEKRRYL